MSKKNEKIIMYVILGVVSFISIKVLLSMSDDTKDVNFENYEKINITNKKLKDNSDDIEKRLENDEYFKKILFIDFYNSANVTTKDLKNMLQTMTYAFSVSNNKYFINQNNDDGAKCLNKFNTKTAFRELFDIDITEYLDFLSQFYQYMYIGGNGYCFNFNTIYNEFDFQTLIGINNISIDEDDNIIVDVYKYDFNKNYDSSIVKSYIDNKNYIQAKNYVLNNYKGIVSHKEVKFKENSKGKFYKYKLIYLKKLD